MLERLYIVHNVTEFIQIQKHLFKLGYIWPSGKGIFTDVAGNIFPIIINCLKTKKMVYTSTYFEDFRTFNELVDFNLGYLIDGGEFCKNFTIKNRKLKLKTITK